MKRSTLLEVLCALSLGALNLAGCGTHGKLPTASQVGAGGLAARDATSGAPVAFIDQEAIFPEAHRLIASARSEVDLDMFFFGGTVGADIASALIERQQAGVNVRVLYDPGMGYHEPIPTQEKPMLAQLHQAGIPTLTYPVSKLHGFVPIKADHDKALIIDGHEAFVGGMNFADVSAPNHDVMVRFGGSAVGALQGVFDQNWKLAGGQTPSRPAALPTERLPAGESVLATACGLFGVPTRPQVTSLIDHAQHRIWLQMFVLADDAICDHLLAAAARGVEVKVLMDPNKFAFGMELDGVPNLGAVHRFYGSSIQVQIYDTKPKQQMHTKMCVFDDEAVTVGSTNWTEAGFDTNNETTLVIHSARLNATLADAFDTDWTRISAKAPMPQKSYWFRGTLAEWISVLF